MENSESRQKITCSWIACCTKGFPASSYNSQPPPPSSESECDDKEKYHGGDSLELKTTRRKPGGWKAMPFILGNETFERLASIGLLANFMVFLLTQFHMDQVMATNVLNIWSGVANYAPLVGAYLSDSYLGRFKTIAYASFGSLMGMLTLTLIAWIPQLHPPPCIASQGHDCKGPTTMQFGVLAMALGFLSIGGGGIRPCSLPFGVDQFDSSTKEGRKGINSFFNWYYTTFIVVLIIAVTIVVYIQDTVSWVWGFSIPTMLMLCSIVLFFIGRRLYVHVKPEGSIFSGIAQSLVAACKKYKLKLPDEGEVDGIFYDPPPKEGSIVKKLPLTNKFRFLNKAAIIVEGELQADGSNSKPWRLCSIQQIEELKCILKIIPVWASGIICFTAIGQQGTFTVSQATKMDRHLGPHFQIPAGSLSVISMISIGVWLPLYDRVIVPSLRRVTKIEGGITLLQRIGIGLVFSILSMVAAGLTERKRRASALEHARPDGIAPISVMWLAPQLILMGFAEAFNIIGQIEFYNKEFPENMSSVANSLFSCTEAAASYLSALMVNIVHNVTRGKNGQPDWLTKDINAGKVENFYFLIAGLGVMNFVYFLLVARRYQYKSRMWMDEEEKPGFVVELNVVK